MDTKSRRSPKPGELQQASDKRLLTLYKAACKKLRDAGGWRGDPLSSRWARAIVDAWGDRGGAVDKLIVIEREIAT